MTKIPTFDDDGINIADPEDVRGFKTGYISELQIEAIRRCLANASGVAVDVGCGYGRMTSRIRSLGFDHVIGVDPSSRVIEAARALSQDAEFRVGALPTLPLSEGEGTTVFILNVLRSLHLLGCLDVAGGVVHTLASGGRLVVLDNLRKGHPDYIKECDVLDLFSSVGLRLVERRAIRGARWPWIQLVKIGLVPRACYQWLISFELALMKILPNAPRWQYINVVWVFERA